MIYLDNNATTKMSKNAIKAMFDIAESAAYNPSSAHTLGREAKAKLEKSRKNFLDILHADSHKLIFTSSGTESNNLLISNFIDKQIFISSVEHPSIDELHHYYDNIFIIPVSKDGLIDLEYLESKLESEDIKLVSVIYANNETGIIQDIKKISDLAHKYNSYIHSDITQVIGKIDISISDLGLDFATFSSHKFHGPNGCGGLIYPDNFIPTAQIFGGGQELGFRSGTENLAAIIGAETALDEIEINDEIKNLRDYLENEILNISPDTIIIGKDVPRLPNTSMISMPDVDFNTQIIKFDLEDIAISSGSACSSARITESRILTQMNIDKEISRCCIRVSLSKDNTKKEIDRFISVWKKIYDNK